MPTSRRSEISAALRQRILNQVYLGRLAADARLPSARRLARELEVDARVVVAAFQSLAAEGVVERRPPSRAFFVVLPTTAGPQIPTVEWLVDVFADGLARGIHAPDLPEQARRAMDGVRLRAACVECNTDQLVWLARELEEDYGISGAHVELDLLDTAGEPPLAMRHADVIVTTPSHAQKVRDVAEHLETPLAVVALREDLTVGLQRLLALQPVYFIGTDPRFGEKLRNQYRDSAVATNVRPIIVGRDDVAEIPAGSHAWVMRTAREALGGVPEHVQALSTLRAFGAETQRTLLRFVVQANLAALAHRPRLVERELVRAAP